MKKYQKIIINFFYISIIFSIFASSFLYSLEFKNSQLKDEIIQKQKEINDLMIKKNTASSKEQAVKEKDLQANDNVYYSKDQE